ncbi:MAG TPA: YfiR family protein [Terriglobales bacterium]|jgi:hypothetical protein
MNTTGGWLHSERKSLAARISRVRRFRNMIACFSSLLSLLLLIPVCSAQLTHPTEFQVESAYLYNFGKFVQWPPDRVQASDSLQICLLGKDPFGAILDSTVAGEKIDGRAITVRRLSTVDDSSSCGILFISSSEEARLNTVLAIAQRSGELTVSDIPHFAERGGTIGFVMQQGRIRFEVNRAAAVQSHLTLSSELLKVASKVINKPLRNGQP